MAKETRKLVLGWKVTKGMDPEYWLGPNPKPGKQQDGDLIAVAAENIAQHTMIIAQSGSGKSFFLGRLIEEIVLQTRCNVLVLDPNSDFRTIHNPTDKKYWRDKTGYVTATRKGYLPDEVSQSAFLTRWRPISKRIYTRTGRRTRHTRNLIINWHSLSIDWLFPDASPTSHTELAHFHEFMHLVTLLLEPAGSKPRRREMGLLEIIRDFCKTEASQDWEQIAKAINGHETFRRAGGSTNAKRPNVSQEGFDRLRRRATTIERAAIHLSYVTPQTVQYYFSVLHEKRDSRLFTFRANRSVAPENLRVRVFDLPSIDDFDDRVIIASAVLDREWAAARARWRDALDNRADEDARVHTFIVVDEAHNFVFAKPRNPAQIRLQEQFRRIAAEGRKFGIFLILVTQRPDKVDPWVISEMENRALMKIGSDFVLRETAKLLGLNSRSTETATRCLDFDSGRALLIGPWAGKEDTFLYSALRRTEEGG